MGFTGLRWIDGWKYQDPQRLEAFRCQNLLKVLVDGFLDGFGNGF